MLSQIKRLEFFTVLILLKWNAFGTGLDGIETIALQNEDETWRSGLTLSIGQYPLDHRGKQYGART